MSAVTIPYKLQLRREARSERADVGLGVQQAPELLGSAAGEAVLDPHAAAQPDHVGGFI